jgi:subfamily B ATP-binding cassette protein MsbA
LNQENISSFKESFALYKRVWMYLRRYWKVFALSLLSMLVAASTDTAFAWLMKPLINGGFIEHDPLLMVIVPLAIVGLFLIRGIFSFISDYASTWLSGHLVASMREDLFHKLLNLPVSYYDDYSSGRLMSRITNDVSQVTDAGFNIITVVVKDGFTILGLLTLLLYHDWQLTLICLAMIPVVAMSIRLVGKRLRRLAHVNQKHVGEIMQVLGESISCQKMVKVYGGEEYEARRFAQAVHAMRRNQVKQSATTSSNTGITQFIIALALAVIIYFASVRSAYGFSAGDFLSFLTAMIMLFAPVKRITGVNQSLQRGLAAAESVFNFLDIPSEPDEGETHLHTTQGMLRFENVGFHYVRAEKPALININFTVQSGETIALVGSSGSGKTTLVSLIPRFYDPTHGHIFLDGIDTRQYTLRSLREHIAFVSQDVVLFNDTVEANIIYGCKKAVTREVLLNAAKAANALDFIEEMPDGFNTLIGENGVRLSGGQRQRLAIARALLKNAPILILDEATSALDTHSEKLVQGALENLMKNRTTIVIAHRLSTIENADRIMVLHYGQIIEEGTHHSLLKLNGAYAQLHKLQFKEPTISLDKI